MKSPLLLPMLLVLGGCASTGGQPGTTVPTTLKAGQSWVITRPLVAAQPGITLLDPLVSLLWGTVVLGESTRTGPILLLAALGALAIVTGVLVLVRSSTARYASALTEAG